MAFIQDLWHVPQDDRSHYGETELNKEWYPFLHVVARSVSCRNEFSSRLKLHKVRLRKYTARMSIVYGMNIYVRIIGHIKTLYYGIKRRLRRSYIAENGTFH